MRFGVRQVAIVKAHGAIGAEVVGIAGFGGVEALDTVGAAARGNLAFAVKDKIDLLGDFVVMREVGAGGGEVHQEEIDDVVGGVDAVAGAVVRADHELVENRGRMATDGLLFKITQIGDFQFGRLRECDVGGNLDRGEYDVERLRGAIGNGVADGRRDISEVVGDKSVGLIGEVQEAATVADEIDFLLAGIGDRPAFAARRDGEFTKAGNAQRVAGFGVAFPEERRVMTGGRGDVDCTVGSGREIPMKPGRLDAAVLGKNSGRDKQQNRESHSHWTAPG